MTTYADATKYDVEQSELGKPYRVCIVGDDGSTTFDAWYETIDEALVCANDYRKRLKPEFAYKVAIFGCYLIPDLEVREAPCLHAVKDSEEIS